MSVVRTLLLLAALALPGAAYSLQIQVGASVAFVYIQIGHGLIGSLGLFGAPAGQIDEVAFSFPAGVQPGDGTPIVGTPTIPVALLGYSNSFITNYRVTMNSSAPLANGTGDTLPFSEISWTTRDGDINSGQFDDSGNQLLQQYSFFTFGRGRGVVDYLTFRYANDTVYPAGTYTGRVVYTVTEL
jgi:hypothetical protein